MSRQAAHAPLTSAEDGSSNAYWLSMTGSIFLSVGDYSHAKPLIRTAEENSTWRDDQTDQHILNIQNLGTVFENVGDYEQAAGYFKKAVDLCRLTSGGARITCPRLGRTRELLLAKEEFRCGGRPLKR